MEYVKYKINETYKVAMKLGLENANEIERNVFKEMLYQIAIAANDEMRQEVSEVIHKQANKYTTGAVAN